MVNVAVICSNLIERNGKFLLVKETKEIAKGRYSLPSGVLEGNEDIVEGAIREAKEETGLDVEPKILVGIFQRPNSKEGHNFTVFVFKSEVISGELTCSSTHPEVRYFSIDEIKEMERKQQLRSPYITAALENYFNNKFYDMSVLKTLKD